MRSSGYGAVGGLFYIGVIDGMSKYNCETNLRSCTSASSGAPAPSGSLAMDFSMSCLLGLGSVVEMPSGAVLTCAMIYGLKD